VCVHGGRIVRVDALDVKVRNSATRVVTYRNRCGHLPSAFSHQYVVVCILNTGLARIVHTLGQRSRECSLVVPHMTVRLDVLAHGVERAGGCRV
jgi:hypothetical protein